MRKTFFEYAIPSVVAMWVFSFYTMVDGFFVSWGVGPMALASVNIAMPFINLIFGVSILCSAGASTVISIYLGKSDLKLAKHAFMTNLSFLTVISLLMTVFSLLFIDRIVLFLGATPHLFLDVKRYLLVIVCFTVFFIITYYFEVMARADGFPRLAATAVALAAVANILLDYVFVIKFRWGVTGAAYATGIAQMLSALLLLLHFLSKRTKLKIGRFRFDIALIKRGVRLGLGDSITEFSVGAAIFFFNHRILSVIGEEGVVSYTVIAYVTTLVVMTMIGISQGMQPLVSYHYGRGHMGSCSYLLKLALKTAIICSIGWFGVMEIFTKTFVSVFISSAKDPDIYNATVSAFRIYSISYLFIGVNIVLSTFFSSVEQALYGIFLSTARGLVVITVALYAMSEMFGAIGIWLSPTISELFCTGVALASLYLLRRAQEERRIADPI